MKIILLFLGLFVAVTAVKAQNVYNYGFTTGNAGLTTDGWQTTNQSSPATATLWAVPVSVILGTFDGGAQSLPVSSFANVNFTSVGVLIPGPIGSTGSGPISNWLISPEITVKNGDEVSFYTRKGMVSTSTSADYPDRLQLRMSTVGALTVNPSTGPTDLGTFTNLLVDVNPTLIAGVYPRTWKKYTYTVVGITTPTTVKFGFRYFVTNGGIEGLNSDRIGLDTFSVDVPEPCAPPSDLTASLTTTTSSSISWTAPTNVPANGYEYYYSTTNTAPTAATTASGSTAAGIVTVNLTSLLTNSNYYVWVRSICSTTTTGSWSTTSASFNTTAPPGCNSLIAPLNMASNIAVNYTNSTINPDTRENSVELSWAAPTTGGVATGYKIYLGASATTLQLLNPTSPFVGTNASIPSVSHNTTYYWSIVAVNAGGLATGCVVKSFTTGPVPVGCMNGTLYPGATYTPATCDGVTVNQINTDAFAGEYANVAVTAGQTYQFRSSVPTDFLSVSTDAGINAAAGSTTPLTWTATTSGTVRFYINLINCGIQPINRTRSVLCGVSLLATDTFISNNFKSFPNPVKDILNLSYDKNINLVYVINLLGQEVLSTKLNNNEANINMSGLKAGIYVVKVSSDNEVKTIKIIKE